MKKFIILFREPDGRMIKHTDSETKSHQDKWCSSADASNKSRQTKIAIALTLSFQGFKQ